LIAAMYALGAFHVAAYSFWFPSAYLLAWTDVPEIFFGLSYTSITTINSVVSLCGIAIGLPAILWLAQGWRYGTGPFAGKKGCTRAFPIVVCASAVSNLALFVSRMLIMDKSYVGFLVNTFFDGFGQAAGMSLNQQMALMAVPSGSRAAAVALSGLTSGLISAPASQIVGMISDAIRGDSTLPYDRFHAYQLV
ncbi:hypothetical protein PMAYCL1PPCAC_33041, partial [Pristionchus mayeri]